MDALNKLPHAMIQPFNRVPIPMMILNGKHQTVSALVVPLEYIAFFFQQEGDTLSVAILSSNQKRGFLQMISNNSTIASFDQTPVIPTTS